MSFSVSSVILTKNEVFNIERCITSLQWCKEIVVVDSGSSDGTIQLANELGAKIFTHIQSPPYKAAVQRNWALQNCSLTGDWVLFVDADEVITLNLAGEIQRVCSSPENPFNAFQLPPRYLFWGKWMKRTLSYPVWHDRLLKRGEVFFADGGYMEHFTEGAKLGRLNEPYDHYANSKGVTDWFERVGRYSSWDAECIFNFLETGNPNAIGTKNKLNLRILATKFWFIRPVARFIYMYIIKLGFLEGWQALIFSLLIATYEFMVVVKIIDLKRLKAGLPL
ncbi:MAG: glycosyltransferase family 2 protein [Nostoc sp.]|uniref:glycosyltransferase family 2 protein n=1 Tax=Nostoc sp. TaxID=1180 RepID=UPI002FFA0DF1